MAKILGIYRITNTVSGRKYIGSSADIKKRFRVHRRKLNLGTHENEVLQNSWNKHGEKCFLFEIIEILEDKKSLIDVEQKYLDNVIDFSFDYNIARDATASMRGRKHSEETKKLMSEKHKGENNAFYGKRHSKEARKKMSEARKGKPIPQSALDKWSDGRRKGKNHPNWGKTGEKHNSFGTHHSEETKRKISESNRGKIMSAESKEKMSVAQRGEKGSRSKLSNADAIEIRRLYFDEGYSLSKISEFFPVKSRAIGDVVSGESFSDAGGKTRPKKKSTVINMDIAKEIRNVYSSGRYTKTEVAEMFSLNVSTARDVINNRTWKEK